MTKPLSAPSAAPAGEPQDDILNRLIEKQRLWCVRARKDVADLLAIVLALQPSGEITQEDADTVNDIESRYRAGDAVPRTPEPPQCACYIGETESLGMPVIRRCQLHQDAAKTWVELQALKSVTAHKEAEIAQLRKERDLHARMAANGEETIGRLNARLDELKRDFLSVCQQRNQAKAEVERLRKELEAKR